MEILKNISLLLCVIGGWTQFLGMGCYNVSFILCVGVFFLKVYLALKILTLIYDKSKKYWA